MPWKKDGEKWHLGDKGFPPGQGAKWDRALLPRLMKLLREIDPTLEFKWDVRDAVAVCPKGAGGSGRGSRRRTRRAGGVVRRPPGQLNLAQFEDSAATRRSRATAPTASRC